MTNDNGRKKKTLVIIISTAILFLIIGTVIISLSVYFNIMIQNYSKITHKRLLEDPKMRAVYKITDKITPVDFGFSSTKEYSFDSVKDGVPLNGWFIPAENGESTRAIILFHGRMSNRLRTLKYLELIKEKDLNREYAVFIPDLRNSGKSGNAETAMGYKFADDIYSCVKHLKDRNSLDTFVLWGFSMGGIGTALALERYQDEIKQDGIRISKVILDSPLSNVSKQIKYIGKLEKAPGIVSFLAILLFNFEVDFAVNEMRLSSILLKNPSPPVLVLQSKSDDYVPYFILKEELALLGNRVQSYIFDKGDHVEIYSEPGNKKKYTELVYDFIINQ